MTTPEMVERAKALQDRQTEFLDFWYDSFDAERADTFALTAALSALAPPCGACEGSGVVEDTDFAPGEVVEFDCPTCNGSGTQPGIYLGISADVAGRVVKATPNDNRYGRYWSLTPVESGETDG